MHRIVIVGGGAAGFFAAIVCAEANPAARITLLEQSAHFLAKVRISGGGRCNVTHACTEPRQLSTRYPRGQQALIAPFLTFQVPQTIAWFERHGVRLKTEGDGRMFPVTDTSQTVVDCLTRAAANAGVEMLANRKVEAISRRPKGGFTVTAAADVPRDCDAVLLATGGCRVPALGALAISLGHTLVAPVPSLFTFHVRSDLLTDLAGVSVESVVLTVPQTKLREGGPMLITHWGLSGPAVLRLSAWGARVLHAAGYNFLLHVNWLPRLKTDAVVAELQRCRGTHPAKFVANVPIAGLPSRLWQRLTAATGIAPETRWSSLSRAAQHHFVQQLIQTELNVTGKSLNKDEFVTCGGVPLHEIDFKTMESKCCPGLYFAGELLDIDGITGGYNFQAAWTTGWLAGNAMARE